MSKEKLEKILSTAFPQKSGDPRILAGIGEDAGVVRLSDDMALVSHVDFLTPIVDDPYIQGKIAAVNTASDLYAKGAVDIVTAMMLLAIPEDMPTDIQQELTKGFADGCEEMKAPVVGGQTGISPWPIIGGSMSGLAKMDKIPYMSQAKPGDILVLTKPLGTQPVMATLRLSPAQQDQISKKVPAEIISSGIDKAIHLMTETNKAAAEAMNTVGANACTDITGFGIIGHAGIMAEASKTEMILEMLPAIKGAVELGELLEYHLSDGESSETSGGLLISVPARNHERLLRELEKRNKSAWTVGKVRSGDGRAYLSDRIVWKEV